MARGFNEKERELITNRLIEEGRKLFSQWGFQKTSIVDITRQVGIAPGTFYTFFHSKEALYFGILEKEEEKIGAQFFRTDIFDQKDAKHAIKQMLKKMLHVVETNPFIRELYVGGNMQDLQKGIPSDVMEKHFERDTSSLLLFMEEQEDIVFAEKPEIITGILRSLFVMTLHRKEIGEDVYPETMGRLIDMVVDGIVKEGK